jgi:hypothetical protein
MREMKKKLEMEKKKKKESLVNKAPSEVGWVPKGREIGA